MDTSSYGAPVITSHRQLRPKPGWRAVLVTLAFGPATVGILCGIALLAGRYERGRFLAEVEVLHRRGEPVLIEDFRTAPVPDETNAAIYLTAAATSIHTSAEQDRLLNNMTERPFGPAEKAFAREILASHPDLREQLRGARACTAVDWHVVLKSPVMETVRLKYLNEQRQLARVLFAVALYEQERGDDASAIQTARDMVMVGRAVDHQPFGASHVVASGIDRLVCALCVWLAPSLRTASESARNEEGTVRPAARVEVLALARELLDDTPRLRAAKEALQRDRMQDVDALVHLIGQAAGALQAHRVYSDAALLLEGYDGPLAASQALDWKTAQARLATHKLPRSNLGFVEAVLGSWPIHLLLRETTERRIAATALALRLYAVDHGGQWPDTLNEMVPKYLDAVPVDPFANDGHAIRYVKGNPPLLYSVSTNARDDHADRSGEIKDDFYDPWRAPDAVFPMGGVLRSTAEQR